jgi:hypothetical protein
MTKAEKKHLTRLADLGCIVCREQGRLRQPSEIHHLRGHPWSGMGQRASHYAAIPLCPIHHRHGGHGEVGYHQSPKEFEARYGSQGHLLSIVEDLMGGGE